VTESAKLTSESALSMRHRGPERSSFEGPKKWVNNKHSMKPYARLQRKEKV
jgi:hypothetical protein